MRLLVGFVLGAAAGAWLGESMRAFFRSSAEIDEALALVGEPAWVGVARADVDKRSEESYAELAARWRASYAADPRPRVLKRSGP